MELIKGKVAKIKDAYSVVINKGCADGVEDGMRFIIYNTGEEIFDPDTKESLGYFEYVKAKVKITYVSEKYSIGETYENEFVKNPMSGFSGLSAAVAAISQGEYVRKKLPLDFYLESRLPEISTIKEGDLVRQYLE